MKEVFFAIDMGRDCQKRPVHIFESSRPLSSALHQFLRPFGAMSYFVGSPRPLIKMDVPGRFYASGLEGGREFKVTFRESAPSALPEQVYKALHLSFACDGCGACERECPEQAITLTPAFAVDPTRCTHCLRCVEACPSEPPPMATVMLD